MQIQNKIVWLGLSLIYLDMRGQANAPTMPESVTTTVINAKAAGFISSDVFANNTAVPETVAMASESRNHPARNNSTSLSFRARMMDRPSDFHE
jgi:hypothetical protein